MKILIGEISSYKAIVIMRFVKQHYPSVVIYSYDTKLFTQKYHSKYSDKHFIVSAGNIEDDLSTIVKEHFIDYLFPVINESLSRLWKRKDIFCNALSYLGDIASYEVLNNKMLLHKLAIELGVKVPKRYNNIAEAHIPYVIKPTNLSSAKGVIYVKSKEDIPLSVSETSILQQYVNGDGVGFSFYCKDGVIFNSYGHRRLAEYPISGGSSTYREGYINDDMVKMATCIVAHLNYTGFAMFEYKLTPNGETYLIEVNPRIWGSINQGLANGINYFEKIFGKPEINVSRLNREIKTYISPLIYLSLIKYGFKANFKPLLYWLKNYSLNSSDVSLLSDFKGWVSLILRKLYYEKD